MLKLVIFDYDGLLVASEKLAYIAEGKVLAEYGKPLTKELFDKYLGFSVRDTLKGYIDYYKVPITPEEFYTKREVMINKLLDSDLKLMPGALQLLQYLKSKNIDMAIASSGEINYIQAGLKRLNIKDYFKNITSISEVKRGKPYPDLFLKVLRKNIVKSSEAIVLEDSVAGIQSAKNAGIFCIAVPPRKVNIQHHRIADIIVDHLGKVKNLLDTKILKIS